MTRSDDVRTGVQTRGDELTTTTSGSTRSGASGPGRQLTTSAHDDDDDDDDERCTTMYDEGLTTGVLGDDVRTTTV